MEPIIKLVLPLESWTLQKAIGPVLRPNEWKAIALSLVPPPDSLINTIKREWADLDSSALGRASVRRRIRNDYKRDFRRQLRGNPLPLAVQKYLLRCRQELEAKGLTADPARIRKARDVEAETNEYFQLLQSDEPPEELKPIVKGHPDALNLLWEFALYGEGGNKPKFRRNSEIWEALRLAPEQLESMPLDEGLILCLSRLEALLGLDGGTPDKFKLLRLAQWVVRTHLPPEEEPVTTPEAIRKAREAGLIHRGIISKDKKTGEVTGVQVPDPHAADFIRELEADAEGREDFIQALAHKGICYSDLTAKEWAEIWEKRDLLDQGYEFSSKTGVSISSFYGAEAHVKEQKWGRIKKKIRKVPK